MNFILSCASAEVDTPIVVLFLIILILVHACYIIVQSVSIFWLCNKENLIHMSAALSQMWLGTYMHVHMQQQKGTTVHEETSCGMDCTVSKLYRIVNS